MHHFCIFLKITQSHTCSRWYLIFAKYLKEEYKILLQTILVLRINSQPGYQEPHSPTSHLQQLCVGSINDKERTTSVTISRMHLCPELNFCQCVKTSQWRFTALGCRAENWFAHLAGSDSGHVIMPDVNNKQHDLFFLWIIHESKRLTNMSLNCFQHDTLMGALIVWI